MLTVAAAALVASKQASELVHDLQRNRRRCARKIFSANYRWQKLGEMLLRLLQAQGAKGRSSGSCLSNDIDQMQIHTHRSKSTKPNLPVVNSCLDMDDDGVGICGTGRNVHRHYFEYTVTAQDVMTRKLNTHVHM